MTHNKQFQISERCAWGLCGDLCSWKHGWMWHDGRRSDRLVLSNDRSFYDTYDITHLTFVNIFCHSYSFYFVAELSLPDANQMCQQSFRLICILEHSHGAFDSCTSTDKLSCLTIWSLKSWRSGHIAKLVNKLLFPISWHQKSHFAYLFLHWRRSGHRVFVQIRNVYGD
jgi:hypothetical protein